MYKLGLYNIASGISLYFWIDKFKLNVQDGFNILMTSMHLFYLAEFDESVNKYSFITIHWQAHKNYINDNYWQAQNNK